MLHSAVTTAVAAALLSFGLPASAAAPAPAQLVLQSCDQLVDSPLAQDLMRTVWDAEARKTFAATHAEALADADSFSVEAVTTEKPTNFDTARVRLAHPPLVAGLRPEALTATTCRDGCDMVFWSLDFGPLNPTGTRKLAAWARKSDKAQASDEEPVRAVHLVRPDKTVSLICDGSL